jgi:hypothetical protein
MMITFHFIREAKLGLTHPSRRSAELGGKLFNC